MQYAVTINCNTIDKSVDIKPEHRMQYSEHLSRMRHVGIITRQAYEIGSQGRCHLHATLKCDRPLTQKEISKMLYKKGFYYDCKPVRDIGAWNTYIGKDQPKSIQKTCMINVRMV